MRLLAVLALAVPACLQAQGSFLVKGARVFDGRRDAGVADVLVTGERIAAVGPNLRVPEGATVIDGAGKTLLPGLIDAHVHAFDSALRTALVFGVTTTFDQFTDPAMADSVRRRQARGEMVDVADLYSAGILVTSPKGHGTEYGMVIPTIAKASEAQAFVDARLAEGSQWIKIVYDAGTTYGFTIPTIDRVTLKAVITAAHKRGKLAVVHIGDLESARHAIEDGADGLVHIYTDAATDPAFVNLVKGRRAFIVPTLSVSESISGTASGATLAADTALRAYLVKAAVAGLGGSFPAGGRSRAKYEHAASAVRALHAAGVPILAGTDAPNPGTWHGVSMHRELQLLVGAGLTPVQALASATSVPAAAFRFSDRGRIASGLRADLLLVDGNPMADILATRRIARIWKRGVEVNRSAEREAVRAEAAAATTPLEVPELVASFESGKAESAIGYGWMPSTDAMAGGKSQAKFEVVEGGAAGTAKALAITGTLDAGLPYGWSGAMLLTGKQPMQVANLSSKKEIRFRARGDAKRYTLMLFSESKGRQPIMRTFDVTGEWQEFAFPFAGFGVDGSDIQGLAWTLTGAPGPFKLFIDEVRLR